jgi:hypothetical protein
MRSSSIISNFNAGELSPALAGRTDFEKYKSGCALLENVIPLVQGPAERRPGTHFITGTKNQAQKTWLVPFEFSTTQSYAIELGDVYARFFYQRAQLVNLGSPYEVVAPWGSSDLTNADGTFALSYAQSNDIMFWAHPNFFPQMLSRRSHLDWAFGIYGLGSGFSNRQYAYQFPFKTQNSNAANRVWASNNTGFINLFSDGGFIFQPWMKSCLIELEQSNGSTVPAWEPAKAVAANQYRRVDSRVYHTTAGGTTGSVKPTHTEGTRQDGDPGVGWSFVHPGYGVAFITGVVDNAHATAFVFTELPLDVCSVATNATFRWSLSAWNSNDGYPNLVGFFRERLFWMRNTQIWMSAAGDFFNFAERDTNGDVTAEQAISVTLSSDTADAILWARETSRGLLVGTAGGEWLIAETVATDPLGPGNIQAVPQAAYGSRGMAPVKVQHAVLYMQRGGRKLREAIWAWDTDTVKSRDLTVLSDHITQTGLTQMAFQQEPRNTLWCTRKDGLLLSFTYNSEQDVYGWHRQPLGAGSGGSAQVESICVIPAPDGDQDDLYLIVRRVIGGAERRFVVYLDRGFQDGDDVASAWYLDAALGYTGIPATSISGLTHLIGETVGVLADGAVHPDCVVDGSGAITLNRSASKVCVGLKSSVRMQTMRIDAGAADGTAQGKTKRIDKLHLRFRNTVGCRVGPSFDKLDVIPFRNASMALDTPIPPFTGDKEVPYAGTYEKDGQVCIQQDDPLPFTLVAIMPQLNTQDA